MFLGTLLLASAPASALPLYDSFETYPVGTVLTNGPNGWGASASTVKVETNVAWVGTNAVILPAQTTLSNLVVSASLTNTWTDFVLTNIAGIAAESVAAGDVNPLMTAQWYVETHGYPVMWHPASNAWLVCNNDYWGTAVTNFSTNAWLRFTLAQNYSNHTAALFLNQHLMLQQVPFIANRDQGGQLQLANSGEVASYLDEVSIRYEPTNTTADLDNDGVFDWQEIQLYGTVNTARRLWITAQATNLTSGGAGGGTVTQPASSHFDVPWTMVSTTLQWTANAGYYAADLLTNGVSVGNFTGRNSGGASYDFTNTHNDATVTVAFAQMPVITASNSVFGSVTPASTNFYPGDSRTFTFAATNSHYFISGLLTNGQAVATGSYTGHGTASGSYTWPSITANGSIEVQYAHKYTNTASVVTVGGPGGVGGTVVASVSEVFPGEPVTFTLTPTVAYGVTALTNNGTLAANLGGSLVAIGHTVTDVQANLDVQGVFTYTARRRVPEDYASVALARAAAVAGDTIVVAGGVGTSGGVSLDNLSLTATNLTVTGGLTVGSGTLVGCTGLVVDATTVSGVLVVSNGAMNLGSLSLGVGATVQVVNATAFIVNGVTYTGSFTLDHLSGQTIVPQTPPFSDDFERYTTNPPTSLSLMGHFGWGASDAGVVVQGAVYTQGCKAAELPVDAILSNSLASAASSNIWHEWTYREADRIDESEVSVVGEYASMALLLFVNTHNYLTVYNPETGAGAFNVLSNDVWGAPVAPLSTSNWMRVALNLNYQTHRVAVFLNGRLMFQGLRFINTNLENCVKIQWNAGSGGATYLDDFHVYTNADQVVSGDGDGDGVADAVEINVCGNVFTWPRGSVFKIR